MLTNHNTFTLSYRDFVEGSRWYKHATERNSAELNYLLLGLGGEAGEALDQWKKITRVEGIHNGWENTTPIERLKLVHEVGDTVWYIQGLCIFLSIDLEELLLMNLIKLYERMLNTDKEIPWPLKDLPYGDALKLMQGTESQITSRNASLSTDIDT